MVIQPITNVTIIVPSYMYMNNATNMTIDQTTAYNAESCGPVYPRGEVFPEVHITCEGSHIIFLEYHINSQHITQYYRICYVLQCGAICAF